MNIHEHAENHVHYESSKTCRICTSPYTHESHFSIFGICERCGYKILIVLVCVMIVFSYMAWYGVF